MNLSFRQGGTPRYRNSRETANAGPAIYEVTHHPVLPSAHEPVRVTARLDDPDGIGEAWLDYRLDPAPGIERVSMRDDGMDGDVVAGDGLYSARLPGQPSGTIAAFHVRAADPHGAHASYPEAAPRRECLVRFGEGSYDNVFGTYRIWMTAATHAEWSQRTRLSNEPLGVTFVYGGHRVIHGAQAYFTGSPATSAEYDTPTGTLCGYDILLPSDDPLLGATHLVLDFPTHDATAQRQQVMYELFNQLDLPFNHRRYVNLFVNGVGQLERSGFGLNGTIYEDTQEPDLDLILQWYPEGKGGHLYKGDDWMEIAADGDIEAVIPPSLAPFADGKGNVDPGRYRWTWRHRGANGAGPSSETLYGLVRPLNSGGLYAEDWREAVINRTNWMMTFALNDLGANWDSVGNRGGRNTFLFKPDGGPWDLLSWDFDAGLGALGSRPEDPLFDAQDPVLAALGTSASWQRLYWRTLEESLGRLFADGNLDVFLDGRYEALATVGAASPEPIKDFVRQRRAFLRSQLAAFDVPFDITTMNGQDFDTQQNWVFIEGTSPLSVAGLDVNGMSHRADWLDVTTWRMGFQLEVGTNTFLIEGRNRLGQLVAGASRQVSITLTHPPPPTFGFYDPIDLPPLELSFPSGSALKSTLAITEVLNHPSVPGSEFVEIRNRSAPPVERGYDLGQYPLHGEIQDRAVADRLKGPHASLPPGVMLLPGMHGVVVKNRAVFYDTFGPVAPVLGEFEGELFDAATGQTLCLNLGIQGVSVLSLAPHYPMPRTQPGVSLQLIDDQEYGWHPGNWAVDPDTPATPEGVNSVALDLPAFPWFWITEVQPQHGAGPLDRMGEPDPWCEVYHIRKAVDDLSGIRLSLQAIPEEDLAEDRRLLDLDPSLAMAMPPTSWEFPQGTTIGTNEARLVWLDGQPEQSVEEEWHASFRPHPRQGRMVLSRRVGGRDIYLDHLDYGLETDPVPGSSWRRFALSFGFGGVGFAAEPTPAQVPDEPFPQWPGLYPLLGRCKDPWLPVRVNEWMADNERLPDPADGRFDDWFELFNPSYSHTVYLSGYMLTDQPESTNRFKIPSGFSIPPRGFLLVWADDEPEQNRPGGDLHVPFRLSNDGDVIAVFDPDGALVDAVSFGEQMDDVSEGRVPDGGEEIVSIEEPTPSGINYPDEWPDCQEPPLLSILHQPNTGSVLWFPLPDCRGTFVGECNDDPGEGDWMDLGAGGIRWDVGTQRYLWELRDPYARLFPSRYYRVRLAPR